MRRKLELIESSPSTSAESWREESLPEEKEALADDEETVAECERDITGQTA